MPTVLDSAFVIDFLAGERGASERVARFDRERERPGTSCLVVAEVMQGAHFTGGRPLSSVLGFFEQLDLYPLTPEVAHRAGEVGAELMRRGARVSLADLVVATTALHHRACVVTRDEAFTRIPGLLVETY